MVGLELDSYDAVSCLPCPNRTLTRTVTLTLTVTLALTLALALALALARSPPGSR